MSELKLIRSEHDLCCVPSSEHLKTGDNQDPATVSEQIISNLHFYISAAVLIFGGATAELYHPSSGASCILPTLQNETNFHSLEDYGLMCGGNTKKFKRYVKSEKWNSENLVFFLLRQCKGWCI